MLDLAKIQSKLKFTKKNVVENRILIAKALEEAEEVVLALQALKKTNQALCAHERSVQRKNLDWCADCDKCLTVGH